MKALSIRAPWWWFILHAGKDIENRDWPTSFRGTVYVHASKWFGKQEVYNDFQDVKSVIAPKMPTSVTLGDLRLLGGHIVGTVEIVGCVKQSDSPWFCGEYGFVLRNPKPLARPFAVKGALGFFEVSAPPPAAGDVREQDGTAAARKE